MAMLIPKNERIFVCEYVQLQAVPNADENLDETRVLLAEGPLVLGRLEQQSNPVIQIGVPENMMTWQLTSDLPVLKVLATFETCLQQFTSYAVSEDVQQASAIPGSEQVSSESGSHFTTTPGLAENVRQAGTAVASGVHTVGGLDRTKKTTEAIAKVTTAVAGAVGTAIGSVAQGAVSTAKKSGMAKEGSTSRHAARVGKAGLVALVEVFDAMHDAGRKVVKEGATETATCVQYRYGDEAAEATHKGMNIAVDAYDVYGAYKSMRTKALVKAFAKGAVKHPEGEQVVGSGAGYAPMQTGPFVGPTSGDTLGAASAETPAKI